MSQTKTPPWEREQHATRTRLENCVCIAMEAGYRSNAKRAWAELCALRAVAEAAECRLHGDHRDTIDDLDDLRAALKEWRAICPR